MGLGKFGNKGAAPAANKAPAASGFKRQAPAAAAPKAAPARRKASRWAGIKAAAPQDPIIGAGRYRLRVVGAEITTPPPGKGGKDAFRSEVEVLATDGQCANAEGDKCVILEMLGNKGEPGEARAKTYIMAAAGYEDEDEYNAFDPDGEFIDAVTGDANDYSEAGLTIVGRLVDVTVTLGNPVMKDGQPTGDHFRVYHWDVVAEDEQDTTPRAEIPQ